MDRHTAERLAANEARFQEINSRLADDVAAITGDDELIPFVCECSSPGCREQIGIALAAYRAIRDRDRHYAVAHGHDLPEIERVVERAPGYSVIEKRSTPLGAP